MKTQLLTANEIDRAAEIIRAGGLVGIPTETGSGASSRLRAVPRTTR